MIANRKYIVDDLKAVMSGKILKNHIVSAETILS